MSAPGLWRRWTERAATNHFTPWKYNWLANHKLLAALERVRDHAHGTLLDVGCGSMPFAPVFEGRVTAYHGTDLPSSRHYRGRRPIAFAPAEALPFRAGSFDTVLSLSVINCLPEPVRLLQEAHRVLRPGGTAIIEFVQMVPLHVDEPWDYYRFTRYGAEHLLREAGFEVVEIVPVGGLWARVGLSMIDGVRRLNTGPTRVLTEIPARLLYLVLQLVFEGLDRLFMDPAEVLAHVVVARRRG
jgi:SAM-dependent methyltransferase